MCAEPGFARLERKDSLLERLEEGARGGTGVPPR